MRNLHNQHPEDAWDNRELGATEEFARRVSPEEEKAFDEGLGLQIISIRLQKSLLEDLKELAKDDGLGYQPYMRRVLTQHVRNEKRKREKHVRVVGE